MSNHMSHTNFTQITSIDPTSDAVYAADGLAYADQDNATSSTSEAPLPSPNAAGSKKRKTSKVKGAKQLSRSASTPQMRDDMMSDDDKKRNKLGYQRISIACAHCRRRKIRCVLSDGDPQQRCQNCIRLKKECVFYPVDQQTAMETRGDSGSKPVQGSGPSSIVSSSPSNPGLDRHFDSSRDLHRFSSLPSNAPSRFQGLPLEPGSALSGQGIYAQHDYSYHTDGDSRPWPPPATLNSTGSSSISDTTDGLSSGYSRYPNASGVGGDFAPFPGPDPLHLPQHPHNSNNFDFSQQRDGALWQHSNALRSMSYGNVETLRNDPRSFSMHMHSSDSSHHAAMHYTPSLDVQNVPGPPHGAPHSAPVGPHVSSFGHSNAYEFQHTAQGDAQTHAHLRSQAYGAAWYADHPSFGPLAEEPESYGAARSQPG